MEGVTAVKPAELVHLDALAVVHLVLRGDVVTTLAVLALESYLHTLFVLRHEYGLSFLGFRPKSSIYLQLTGSGGGTRTRDTTIMSRVL